jgi:hypothetical protein
MPALSEVHLLSRDDNLPRSQSSLSFGPVYIIGIALVGCILLGISTWLLLRLYRKRLRAKREDARGAAFLSVKGLVRESAEYEKSSIPPEILGLSSGDPFSRDNITQSVVLPDKVLLKKPEMSREDIIRHHRDSNTVPNPFSMRPFSFALNAGTSRPSSLADSVYSQNTHRQSDLLYPSSPSGHRFSVMSSASSMSSLSTGHGRNVKQLFTPVLPDELTIHLGERLTVIESFDDGWCLVGREGMAFIAAQKSLFKPAQPTPPSNVELGVIPAWTFIKPVKGLRAERPVRSTSLGITVNIDGPGFSDREQVMSWSNF